MPILPLIDALIFMGWSSLTCAFLLKAVYVSTSYRPHPFGMGPLELVIVAVVCLLFALALAARTWVKANEPRLIARRRASQALREMEEVRAEEAPEENGEPLDEAASGGR
ncbi:MAG: hypothetical protein QNK03_06935 [Myxococcota bacterium]|nr:hypothetical protein [Myxococcota bacterium]